MTRYAGLPPPPDRIKRLEELAANLRWSWQYVPRQVFRTLDYQLWRATAHNPVRMLWLISRERLEQAARDPEFLATYDAAVAGLDAARASRDTWMARKFPDLQNSTIAYFSAEFAIHQSLPIYAGGLGVLAGDHCKQASDLGVPLVGIGFMYPQGYFHQHISAEGWQQETYERLNWPDVAIEQALKPDGNPCIVAVPLGDRAVLTNVWKMSPSAASISTCSTPASKRTRRRTATCPRGCTAAIARRAFSRRSSSASAASGRCARSASRRPSGTSTKATPRSSVLQRIYEQLNEAASFDDALECVRRSTIFTTHTPVAAGHDAFPFDRVEHHLAGAWGPLSDHRARFLALGDYGGQFNMTALALRAVGLGQRRQPAARRGHRQDVGAAPGVQNRQPAPADDRHQRRARADLDVAGARAVVGSPSGSGLGRPLRRPRVLDRRAGDSRRRALAGANRSLKRFLFAFIRQRARDRWAQENVSAAQVVASGPLLDPGRADDRLRAPLHGLQTPRSSSSAIPIA